MRHSRLALAVFAAVLIGPICAAAQPADTTQLPEIAPREIEIRGEREIDLPSLERQPLTGFASPPSVPAVPADHRPYVGSYRQTLDDLPESLPVPESVSSTMRPAADPAEGFLEVGSGRYVERFLEGRVGVPLTSTERLTVAGQYTGTEADPNDDVAELEARLESQQDGVRLTAEAHGTLQRYALYGASLPPSNPKREGYAAGGSFGLETTGSVPLRAGLTYDNVQYTSYLDTSGTDLTQQDLTQQQVQIQAAGTIPLPLRPRLDARYRRSWFGGDVKERTAYSVDAGGSLALYRSPSLHARVGGRLLAYEAPTLFLRRSRDLTVGDATATFLSPTVDVEWQLSEETRLHLRNRPRLGETALHALYATNPYAEHAPSLRPTLVTTDAEAGLTWSPGPVRLVVAGGYRYAPVYRSFALNAGTGLYVVNYNSTRILHGRGQVALQGIDGVQASLEVSVRDGVVRAQNRDRAIPNFAPVTADALVAVSFAGGDGYVEAQAHFQSPRYSSTARQDRVGSYFAADLESSYAVTSQLEVVVQARNLSSGTLTHWQNYPRPPARLAAGLRLNW